jgi:hypothetical protein
VGETLHKYKVFVGKPIKKWELVTRRMRCEDTAENGLRVMKLLVDGTGSGLCPVVGFVISGIEPLGHITGELYASDRLSCLDRVIC